MAHRDTGGTMPKPTMASWGGHVEHHPHSGQGHHAASHPITHLLSHCLADKLTISRQSIYQLSCPVFIKERCLLPSNGGEHLVPEVGRDVLPAHPHKVNTSKVAQPTQHKHTSQTKTHFLKFFFYCNFLTVLIRSLELVQIVNNINDLSKSKWHRHCHST